MRNLRAEFCGSKHAGRILRAETCGPKFAGCIYGKVKKIDKLRQVDVICFEENSNILSLKRGDKFTDFIKYCIKNDFIFVCYSYIIIVMAQGKVGFLNNSLIVLN